MVMAKVVRTVAKAALMATAKVVRTVAKAEVLRSCKHCSEFSK